ncbi:hypothetical protein [Latilactobacillus curvatus]|uniref:hypothetical protein n=1 Tax=Latilactobacillus curvatus TaxID=28038 RepID=UPI0020A47CBE|nr:hypothetical protein [Latilactobacillus curvatus]MCT3532644.1 hypothetical protein [Latilactobacillus curvatus]UTC14818.1 hypothetical protein A4W80_07865 [Latilactobacillus curvatus]
MKKTHKRLKKTKTVTPKNGIMTLTDEKPKSKAKTIKGYIYRSGNDYMVLNSEKGYIKNAKYMQGYLETEHTQMTNLFFMEPNTMAIAQNQVNQFAKTFKLAYGKVVYDELPSSNNVSVAVGTITNENLGKLPNIRIYKIYYQVISR